jgi:hypothetical protein
MRRPVDAARVREFFRVLGSETHETVRIYLTGGTTAVLQGWRESTIDIDLKMVPESDALFRAIAALKESLQINVELAAPSDFIPELPGWQERCLFIAREGKIDFFHYDPYSQALSKLQRGHAKDEEDLRQMIAGKLVEPRKARELFEAIAPELYRFPSIDPESFRRRVLTAFGSGQA